MFVIFFSAVYAKMSGAEIPQASPPCYPSRNDPFIAKSSDGTKCFGSECMRWEDNFHIPNYLRIEFSRYPVIKMFC